MSFYSAVMSPSYGNGWGGTERCLVLWPAIPTLHYFTRPSTVLCRATNMVVTVSTCRSSVSSVGNPSIALCHIESCFTKVRALTGGIWGKSVFGWGGPWGRGASLVLGY